MRLTRWCWASDHPVLGVCVGMQMLARGSDEGRLHGLGWIPAEVKRFDENGFTQKTHLPHMGWNDAAPRTVDSLFRSMRSPRFYFLHSYYFLPDKTSISWRQLTTTASSLPQYGQAHILELNSTRRKAISGVFSS